MLWKQQPPNGYSASTEIYVCKVAADGTVSYKKYGQSDSMFSTTPPECQNVRIDPPPQNIQIIKTDDVGGPVAGAVFGLYAQPDSTTPISSSTSLSVGGVTTAVFDSSALHLSKSTYYYIKEITAPSGYVPSAVVYECYIDAAGTVTYKEYGTASAATAVSPTCVNVRSNTPGGNTPGGNTPGGNTPGGNTPGGNTPGGNTPGGNTPGGNTPGGNTPGGNTPGGNTPGGNTPGGNTPGGNTPGGNTPGGNTPGGNTPGGNTPPSIITPPGTNPGLLLPGGLAVVNPIISINTVKEPPVSTLPPVDIAPEAAEMVSEEIIVNSSEDSMPVPVAIGGATLIILIGLAAVLKLSKKL